MKKVFTLLIAAFALVASAFADKVTMSTTLPDAGRPEHVYTMANANNVVAGKTTAPTQTEENYGKFAFYQVSSENSTVNIYNHSTGKWLTYTQAGSYSNMKDFVKFTGNKAEAGVFKLTNFSGDNYEIQPVTTSGGVDKYVNWYQGVDGNPYDGPNTLGLWQDSGSKDGGSSWSFTETVYVVRTYTVVAPDGVKVTINGTDYTNGGEVTVEGSISKDKVSVNAPEGKFAVVSIDDVNNTITVNIATLPVQAQSEAYQNAWVYPKQQDNVGAANAVEEDGVYTLSNRVLAASFMKVGGALYFAGSNAMNLLAGTEPFTVAFGNGDNVPASAMTLKNIALEDLAGNQTAVGGAEHFDGKQIVANL